MRKFAWLVVCILVSSPLFGQLNLIKKKIEEDKLPWSDGSILLTDDTRLTGQVRYDDRNGVLSFRDVDESKAFNPRRVMAFDFYDQELHQRRQFITLPFEESGQLFFFEILRELKTFAVLVKTDPVELKEYTSGGGSPTFNASGAVVGQSMGSFRTVTKATQQETVYVMGTDGEILQLFKRSVDHDPDNLAQTEDENGRGRVFHTDRLVAWIGKNRYTLLEQYARENSLSFNRKWDLQKLMNYYAQNLEPSED